MIVAIKFGVHFRSRHAGANIWCTVCSRAGGGMTRSDRRRKLYISLGDLRPLAAAAEASGVQLPSVFARVGWKSDMLDQPDDTLLPLAQYFRFWEHALHAAQDETMGVSRRPLRPGTTHFVLSHVVGKNNLFDAMKEIAKAYNILHGGSYNHVELTRDRLSYIIDDREFPYASRENMQFIYFAMECVLIFLHSILVLISSERVHASLLKLHLTRERSQNRGRHLDFWGAPIRFNSQKYALIYHPSLARMPISITAENLPPEQAVFQKVGDLIEERQVNLAGRSRVAERVTGLLEQNLISQYVVARKLGLSTATLRRRLSEEGTSFRDLCHASLSGRATMLLSQGLSTSEVADRLGFSDFRSFTRAFKKWTRQTPNAYLARNK